MPMIRWPSRLTWDKFYESYENLLVQATLPTINSVAVILEKDQMGFEECAALSAAWCAQSKDELKISYRDGKITGLLTEWKSSKADRMTFKIMKANRKEELTNA